MVDWSNDSSYLFDGTTGYIDISNFTNTALTEDFTISFWMKADTWPSTRFILDNRDSSNLGWFIRGTSTTGRFHFSSGTGSLQEQTGSLGTVWKHVLFTTGNNTKRAADSKHYFDGVLQSPSAIQDSITGGNTADSGRLRMGRRGGTGNADHFDGRLAQIAMWPSDQSVNAASIYNSGTPHDLNLLATPPLHFYIADGDDTGADKVIDHGSDGGALGTITGGVTLDADTP